LLRQPGVEADNHYEDDDDCYWKVFLSGGEMGKMVTFGIIIGWG